MKNRRYVPDLTHTLNPVAVRAIELVHWRPLVDQPGNTWVADVPNVGVACVQRRKTWPEGFTPEFVGWIDGDESAAVYPSPRVAMDAIALIAVARHDQLATANV